MNKISISVTEESRSNLEKLALFLFDKSNDDNYKFSMSRFYKGELPQDSKIRPDIDLEDYVQNPSYFQSHTCDTVACAAGYGPAAGIGLEYFRITKENGDYLDWYAYAKESFCITTTSAVDDNYIWKWCFDSNWARFDNTMLGAAQRITYLLIHNAVLDMDDNAVLDMDDIDDIDDCDINKDAKIYNHLTKNDLVNHINSKS